MSDEAIRLFLPLDRPRLAELHAGDACLLTGPLYTLRDAGHVRLMAELEAADGTLPYGLDGQAIFYAGPTPAAAGRPFGGRAHHGQPHGLRRPGAAPRGRRGDRGQGAPLRRGARRLLRHGFRLFRGVRRRCAYLAKCVASSETVAYDDLGTEALRRIEVVDFPVFVGVDVQGRDVYDLA